MTSSSKLVILIPWWSNVPLGTIASQAAISAPKLLCRSSTQGMSQRRLQHPQTQQHGASKVRALGIRTSSRGCFKQVWGNSEVTDMLQNRDTRFPSSALKHTNVLWLCCWRQAFSWHVRPTPSLATPSHVLHRAAVLGADHGCTHAHHINTNPSWPAWVAGCTLFLLLGSKFSGNLQEFHYLHKIQLKLASSGVSRENKHTNKLLTRLWGLLVQQTLSHNWLKQLSNKNFEPLKMQINLQCNECPVLSIYFPKHTSVFFAIYLFNVPLISAGKKQNWNAPPKTPLSCSQWFLITENLQE